MSYLILVNDDTVNNRWLIIDFVFPTRPNPPVRYTTLTYRGHIPFTKLGPIAIEDAVTGAKGVGELISI